MILSFQTHPFNSLFSLGAGLLVTLTLCSAVKADCPEGHEIAREQIGKTVFVYCGSDDQERQMKQAKTLVQNVENAGGFRSPLNDDALLAFLVTEAAGKGVPVWLVIGQAKYETTFGKTTNATVQEGRVFADGRKGNAHNLFNLTPTLNDTKNGRVLVTTPKPGEIIKFAVYENYKDCIRAYLNRVSGPLYKGSSLEDYLETYFPKKQNGVLEFEKYLRLLVRTAHDMGENDVDRKTVAVP